MDNNIFLKLYARVYQKILYLASNFLKWREPEILEGVNSLSKLGDILKDKNYNNIMIFTDSYLYSIGIYKALTNKLDEYNIKYTIYSDVVPNPTVENVENSKKIYENHNCEMMVAIGGGSTMDCAKGCGALISRPNKTLRDLKGVLKVKKEIPYLVCVPTTAGTGSEVTIAAVITDTKNCDKYAINDLVLTPKIAVLDPLMTINLPKNMTSTTGMDTLTHAIESYIGKSNTKKTKKYAKKSIKLAYENLLTCYQNGENDIIARQNMQKSSYYGGLAFTRAYVGTVHALAHSLGGFYGVPHGLANAILLPLTLRKYGKSVYKKLAELGELVGTGGTTTEEKAIKFIESIESLNKRMNIPNKLPEKYTIKESDLDSMVDHAFKEINPLYPVPKILSKTELKDIYKQII